MYVWNKAYDLIWRYKTGWCSTICHWTEYLLINISYAQLFIRSAELISYIYKLPVSDENLRASNHPLRLKYQLRANYKLRATYRLRAIYMLRAMDDKLRALDDKLCATNRLRATYNCAHRMKSCMHLLSYAHWMISCAHRIKRCVQLIWIARNV